MNCRHLSQKHEEKSPAKLLFGRKHLSRNQHVNMGAAYNHTEFLKSDTWKKANEQKYIHTIWELSRIKHQRRRVFSTNQRQIWLSFELTLYVVGNKLICRMKITPALKMRKTINFSEGVLYFKNVLYFRLAKTAYFFFVSVIFQMTSVSIRWDFTRVICWIIWTDVLDSFHPYFHWPKRAHGKRSILTESWPIQKRLSLQRKIYKGKRKW